MADDTVELAVTENPKAHQDSLVRTVSIFGLNPTAANNSITTTLYSWWSFPTVRHAPLELAFAYARAAHAPRSPSGTRAAAHVLVCALPKAV